jgi:hypothetical protein
MIVTYLDEAVEVWKRGSMDPGAIAHVRWRELFDTTTLNLTSGVTSYDAPAGFEYPQGYLRVGDTYYKPVDDFSNAIEHAIDPNTRIYWTTGTPGAYHINLFPGITGTGYLDYYKSPTAISALADAGIPAMKDPEFAVHYAVGKLYLDDENTVQAQIELNQAEGALKTMVLNNVTLPYYGSMPSSPTETGFGL